MLRELRFSITGRRAGWLGQETIEQLRAHHELSPQRSLEGFGEVIQQLVGYAVRDIR